MSSSAVPPGLMREFLDKKVALQLHEHMTLGFLATFLSAIGGCSLLIVVVTDSAWCPMW